MTRINATIPPSNLSDQHLIAEYVEIGGVSSVYRKRLESGKSSNDIPEKFTLGRGHVKFFLNKPLDIIKRFVNLKDEMLKRGFEANIPVSYIYDNFMPDNILYSTYYRYTQEDRELIRNRVIERLPAKPRYYSKEVSKEFMINLIRQ